MVHSEKDGQILFHGVNDYYDVNLKYARLAETGISREAENWHTKVQSTKYPNYSFMRMNLEDREQLNLLFELNNVTAYPGMPGDYIPMVIGTAQSGASTDGRPTIF
jgi:hypothetical protein